MNTHHQLDDQDQPIPLRPDRDAKRARNVTKLHRAVFAFADHMLNPYQKSAQLPATTTDSVWAAPLAGTTASDFIASLVPMSAGAKLLEAAPRANLDGRKALLFPRRLGAISATAVPWVGEGDPSPVLQFALESVTLDATKKLCAGVVVTREEMEYTSAPLVMRTLLNENTSAALDASLFSQTASSTSRPAGILVGVSALSAAAAGVDAMGNDLITLAQAIASSTTGLVYVCHSKQEKAIKLRRGTTFPDVEVWPTNAIAAGIVIALDPAAFVSAFGGVPEIRESRETTLHMEGATPLQIASGAQGSGVLATPTRNLWQSDSVAVEIRLRASWAWRASGAVAWMQSVNW